MRGLVRWMAWSLAGLACVVMLMAGGCVLFAQHALHHGALDQPAWSCRRGKDLVEDRSLIERSLVVQIQQRERNLYRQDHGRSYGIGRWHLSGMAALIGLKLGYSPEERRAMAMPTLGRIPLCKPLTAG